MALSGSFGCDIIGQCGDSNSYSGLATDGTPGYDPAIDVTNPLCLEYRNSHAGAGKQFSCVAHDPLDYTVNNPNGMANGIGPGRTFLVDQYRLHLLASNRYAMSVSAAEGGTGFTGGYWSAPSGLGVTNFVTRVNQAIALDARNALTILLWTTGANDAINGMAQATYVANFQTTIAYFRANITGASSVPVLVQGLVPAYVAANLATAGPVDAALKSLPANVSKCGYVDMTNMVGQTAIPYHLNAASQRLVGAGFYTSAYLNLSA